MRANVEKVPNTSRTPNAVSDMLLITYACADDAERSVSSGLEEGVERDLPYSEQNIPTRTTHPAALSRSLHGEEQRTLSWNYGNSFKDKKAWISMVCGTHRHRPEGKEHDLWYGSRNCPTSRKVSNINKN